MSYQKVLLNSRSENTSLLIHGKCVFHFILYTHSALLWGQNLLKTTSFRVMSNMSSDTFRFL